MSDNILDTTQDLPTPSGLTATGVRVVETSDRIRLTIEARAAAVDAAARLVASGRFAGRAPLEIAETFEAWILRPEDDA